MCLFLLKNHPCNFVICSGNGGATAAAPSATTTPTATGAEDDAEGVAPEATPRPRQGHVKSASISMEGGSGYTPTSPHPASAADADRTR